MPATRRLLALLAVPVAAAVALAGCSSSAGESGSANGTSTSSGSEAGAFPATVSTMFGDIEIGARPKRVVALGWADAETLYALGVQPVGMSDWLSFGGNGVGPWATSLVTEPAEQLGTTEPDFEKIAALQPDLILDTRSDNSRDTYDTLSAIAPTVYGPSGVTSFGTSWEQQVTSVSEAVGLEAEGKRLISDTKAKIAAAAKANPALAGKTFTSGALFGTDQWAAYVSGDLRVDLLTELGMTNKPAVESQKKDSFYVSVSPENLAIFDADLTVMFAIGDNQSALENNAVLRSLPSAEAGHLVVLSGSDADAYSLGSTLAIDYALQNVVPKLATAAGADTP